MVHFEAFLAQNEPFWGVLRGSGMVSREIIFRGLLKGLFSLHEALRETSLRGLGIVL